MVLHIGCGPMTRDYWIATSSTFFKHLFALFVFDLFIEKKLNNYLKLAIRGDEMDVAQSAVAMHKCVSLQCQILNISVVNL